MRVWEKIDLFQEERGSWNGWRTSLTRHAALNHARRISRHGGTEALSEDPPSPELTPEEVLLRQERQTALQAALEQLSAGERLLFYRKYYYLPSTAQIALELGLTERAVEGRLYRLKRQLRKCREVMRVPKEDWGFLNEKAFEAALQASVPERLPDKAAAAVTPWKRAMGRVLAGMALTGTNLWGLNYPLPGIGLVLMLLGFRLLRREEIEACRGAIQVVVSVQEFDQEGGFCRSSGSNPLCITGVGVKLTGEPASWMIFHHFLWNTAPPFHGTAAIQLWPVHQSDELWSAAGEVADRVLYDRDGETFWAPYHSLEEDPSPCGYQGIYGQRDIFGTFSLSTAA